MKKIKNILILSISLMIFVSCGDNLLQENPTSQPSQNSFWLRNSDFQSALAGCYSYFYEWPGELSQIQACYDGLTDNANTQYDEDTYGKSKTIALGDVDPTTGGFIRYTYEHCYGLLARVNNLVEHLENYKGSDMSEDDKNMIFAQCHAMRGYCYSILYQSYREVPLVKSTLNMSNMYQPKATRNDILDYIIDEYDKAIASLPDKKYSDSSVNGHFTVDAVKALKARLIMFDGYDQEGNSIPAKMKDALELLETIKNYSLSTDMRDNFITGRQSSCPEIMFSVRYLAPNIKNKIDLYFGRWVAEMPTRDLIDAFECTDGNKWSESPLAVHPNEEKLYAMGNSTTEDVMAERAKLFVNRDKRFYQCFSYGKIGQFTEDGFTSQIQNFCDGTLTGFTMTKLIQPTKDIISESTVCDCDVVIMRYAHVLLMIAEAENELNGPTKKSLEAINLVRKRSNQPIIKEGISKNELRERIRNEWRVETCFEGLRYFQLKQWKLLQKNVDGFKDQGQPLYVKVWKPAFEYWPLPQSEIDKSGGILEQDSNYK